MSATFIQQKAEQATSSVSSFTTTAMTVTAGNAIVACMGANGTALTSLNASDSKTDTYTNGVKTLFSANGNVAIGVARSIAGGSTTFTVTPNSARFVSISAQEYSNLGASNEATNSGSATSGTAVSPGAVNPASSGDLYVACWTHDGSVNQTFTFNVSGEGWNQRSNLTNTTNQPLGSQDLVSTGSKTGSATLSASARWEACVATFTSAAGSTVSAAVSSAGAATATFDGKSSAAVNFSSAGVATATFNGQSSAAVAFSTSGVSTATFTGLAVIQADLSAAGQATATFTTQSSVATPFSTSGVATATFSTQASASANFAMSGTATAVFTATSGASSSAEAFMAGSATANFAAASLAPSAFTMSGQATVLFRGQAVTPNQRPYLQWGKRPPAHETYDEEILALSHAMGSYLLDMVEGRYVSKAKIKLGRSKRGVH